MSVIAVNPIAIAKNCIIPADLGPFSCQRARSLGITSDTVTYSRVPPANPCNNGNAVLFHESGRSVIPIPIPIPITVPNENIVMDRRCFPIVVIG